LGGTLRAYPLKENPAARGLGGYGAQLTREVYKQVKHCDPHPGKIWAGRLQVRDMAIDE